MSTRTKLRIFNSNVKLVLFYGEETWRFTAKTGNKLHTYLNHWLRRILNIHWIDKAISEKLWMSREQLPINRQVGMQKWYWIGHTLRRLSRYITRQALRWNLQGKKRKGRPNEILRRDTEKELNGMGGSGTIRTDKKTMDSRWPMPNLNLRAELARSANPLLTKPSFTKFCSTVPNPFKVDSNPKMNPFLPVISKILLKFHNAITFAKVTK